MRQASRCAFLLAAGLCLAESAPARQQQPTDNAPTSAPAAKDSSTASAKPKKVWTDDDLLHGNVPAAKNPKETKTKPAKTNDSKDTQAAKLKGQLEKLQGQLNDTDAKLAELQKFNGDNSSDSAIKLNHRLDRTSIADQITQLQAKKKQIQEQMQNIYDQARHAGIEPGTLR